MLLTVNNVMPLQSQAAEQLRQQTMATLRAEHPDWSDEMLHGYETRFAELLRQIIDRAKPQHPEPTAQAC